MKGVSLGSEDSGASGVGVGWKGTHIRKLGPGHDCQGAWVGRAGEGGGRGCRAEIGGGLGSLLRVAERWQGWLRWQASLRVP